jgi:6-pyruvoyltetrahydropterin/6-carboxytetrahydropterin synthase
MYQSTKLVDGFSTCFRQWRANSHCNFLHGYSVSFKLTFQAKGLDDKNWVQDFGFLKTKLKENTPGKLPKKVVTIKDWFNYMFDHTTVVASDDPMYEYFDDFDTMQLIQLRTMPNVGCEAFAKYVFDFIEQQIESDFIENRVKLLSVECIEHDKNSAIYIAE